MWRNLGDRPIEALLDLPLMSDAIACGTMDVLNALMPPAWYTDLNLAILIIGRMTNLSLAFGNSDASSLAYAWLGMILGPHYGDYKTAYRFGRLGLDLVEQRGMDRFQARVYQVFGGHVMQWTRPIRDARSLIRRAVDVADKLGDLTYAAFARNNLITHYLACGDPLAEVQHEAATTIDFARRAGFGLAVDRVTPQLQLARTLRGLTPIFGSFNDTEFDEAQFERYLDAAPASTLATCWYWIRKLQARYLAGDHVTAIMAADRAEGLVWTSPSFFEQAEYHFYAALARAASCDKTAAPERARHQEALADHHRQLMTWAGQCPENFAARATLVGAEIARLDGRDVDAMKHYERSIRTRGTMISSIFRHWPTNWPLSSMLHVALKRSPVSICRMPATAIFAGAPTARSINSTPCIRNIRVKNDRPCRRRSGRQLNIWTWLPCLTCRKPCRARSIWTSCSKP